MALGLVAGFLASPFPPTLQVPRPNVPPVAVAHSSSTVVAPGQNVSLDGRASYDPDGFVFSEHRVAPAFLQDNPSIAAMGNDTVSIAWDQMYSPGIMSISVIILSSAGSVIEAGMGGPEAVSSPSLAISGDTAFVVWQHVGAVNGVNFSAISPRGFEVYPMQLSPLDRDSLEPAIAVDNVGGVNVVWTQYDLVLGQHHLWQTRSVDGGSTWSAASLVNPNSSKEQRRSSIDATIRGIDLAWVENEGGPAPAEEWHPFYATGGVGQQFSVPIRVDGTGSIGSAVADRPSVSADLAGRAFVGWACCPPGESDSLLYVRNPGAKVFSAPVVLNDDGSGNPQSNVTIATDGNGLVHAAWEDRRSQPTSIYHASFIPALSQATSNDHVSALSGVAVHPAIARDTNGNVLVAWADDRNGRENRTVFFSIGNATGNLSFSWDFGDGTGAPGEFASHAYATSGTYTVRLTVVDPLGAQGTDTLSVTVRDIRSPGDLKHEAIQQIKALKEQALTRGDKRFVHKLDEAEEHVWKSLGFKDPFRPDFVAALPSPDVTVRSREHDNVKLALGPSWEPKLASYRSIRLTWQNGVVTVIDLPRGWSAEDRKFHTTPWVDAWHQDIRIRTDRDRRRGVTLDIRAHQASMGFTVSLDGDRVADLLFTSKMRHLWVDASHLDPKHGEKVFDEEKKAVRELLCIGDRDDDEAHDTARDHDRENGDDDHEHEGCGEDDHEHDDQSDDGASTTTCRLDPRRWNGSERVVLDGECNLIANLLVKADEMLALVSLQDAKDTPIRNPHHAIEVQHEIEKAERELKKATSEWNEREYDDAIHRFRHAWEHAQEAIELARR